jgi:hypothetical protein
VTKLSQVDGSVSFADRQAIFTGKVRNDNSGSISTGLVLAVVRQKSDGQIVATSSAHLSITDSAASGRVLDYSITIPLPPDVNPEAVNTEITALGYTL